MLIQLCRSSCCSWSLALGLWSEFISPQHNGCFLLASSWLPDRGVSQGWASPRTGKLEMTPVYYCSKCSEAWVHLAPSQNAIQSVTLSWSHLEWCHSAAAAAFHFQCSSPLVSFFLEASMVLCCHHTAVCSGLQCGAMSWEWNSMQFSELSFPGFWGSTFLLPFPKLLYSSIWTLNLGEALFVSIKERIFIKLKIWKDRSNFSLS